jgi:cytochrome b561
MSTTAAGRDGVTERDTHGAVAPHSTTRRLTTETKHSSKTSELYAYVVATVGVLLAGLLTKAGDGHDDRLQAQETWMIVGILTVGYMLSRGLAKSGSRDPYDAADSNR